MVRLPFTNYNSSYNFLSVVAAVAIIYRYQYLYLLDYIICLVFAEPVAAFATHLICLFIV